MKKITKLLILPLIAFLSSCGASNPSSSVPSSTTSEEQTQPVSVIEGINKNNDGSFSIISRKGLENFRDILKGKIEYGLDGNYFTVNYFKTKTIKLESDIDYENDLWSPIDLPDGIADGMVFDGQGHSVKNININGSNEDNHESSLSYGSGNFTDEQGLGFFGDVASNLRIKDLVIDAMTISAENGKWIGAVVGYSPDKLLTIQNVTVKNSNLTSYNGKKVGGIIGFKKFDTNGMIGISGCNVLNTNIKTKNLAGGIAGQLWQYQTSYYNSNVWSVTGNKLENSNLYVKSSSKDDMSPLCSDDPLLDFDTTSELFASLGNTESGNTYTANAEF